MEVQNNMQYIYIKINLVKVAETYLESIMDMLDWVQQIPLTIQRS